MSEREKARTPGVMITGKWTRLSYANLFEPKSFGEGNGEPVYSADLIVLKEDRESLERIRTAMKEAYGKGSEKLRGKDGAVPPMNRIHLPVFDGDRREDADPVYAGAWYIRTRNRDMPRMFGTEGQDVRSMQEIYSGCYAKCKVQFMAYRHEDEEKPGEWKTGICAILLGMKKTADGERLGAEGCTAEDFEENIKKENVEDDFGDLVRGEENEGFID